MFGGSFDPIHHGHLIAAYLLAESLGLHQVRLVPAAEQPLKAGRHSAEAHHRAAMVELAVRGSERLVADRVEVERPGPSYTVETLRAYRERWPDAALTLLLGGDAAADLPRWRELEAIHGLAEVVVFGRIGTAAPAGVDRVVPVPGMDVSSTAIRARVRAGRPVRYWVPDAVAEYIAAHQLYRDDD